VIDDLPLFRDYEEPDDEVGRILDLLLAHKKKFTADFLKEKDLQFSGTRTELRDRIEDYVTKDKIKPSQLISLLDEIEGWGEQHVYF
jgi:hypothetical protein